MRRKFILENGDLLLIHDTQFPKVRVLNLKTNDAIETENPKMIEKVMQQGEEVAALLDND
jgi:hypothetical protein